MTNGSDRETRRGAIRAKETAGPARSILRGELDRISLATLLTILEMERRSGMLIMQHRRELGRLYIRDGHVLRARIEGGGRGGDTVGGQGAEAVYHMLTWADGQFELWQANVAGPDEIREGTAFLLMESARRTDEANAHEPSAELSMLSEAAGASVL